MGGNRNETEEFSMHMSSRKQQHSVGDEQHPSSTLAWDDTIVMKEEDKNDDSNVSQSSTNNSPNSGLGNVNSPGSAIVNSDYSPQSIYSAESQSHQNTMAQDERNQSMDVSFNTAGSNNNSNIVECSICTFSTTTRTKLVQHLVNHCEKSASPETIEAVFGQLRSFRAENDGVSPDQDEHAEHTEHEETEESSFRVPRLNSQGKMKSYRCKQCGYVTFTKLCFWDHSRIHIKSEKLLSCPKCPFVTEYKHHLEYHLRNHAGSKPFKCPECSYTCVNKSMLNSHMKSHSNVYQYRCGNCSYATKYCHSLKLHLRKYGHMPETTLNPDGTPNEGHVYIDVYGTKRGPKHKPKARIKTHVETEQNMMVNNNNNNDDVQPPDLIQASRQSPVAQQIIPKIDKTNDASEPPTQNNSKQDQPMPYSYSQLLAAFNLTNQLLFYEKKISGEIRTANCENPQECEPNQSASVHSDVIDVDEPTVPNGLQDITDTSSTSAVSSPSRRPWETQPVDKKKNDENHAQPLDLSVQYAWPSTSKDDWSCRLMTSSPKLSGTRKRKGVAVKLVQRAAQESPLQTRMTASDEGKLSDSPTTAGPSDSRGAKHKNNSTVDSFDEYYTCTYCEILFRSDIMHTLHMGCHGYKDPFTCNMCGEKCVDNISFFLHINRSKHA